MNDFCKMLEISKLIDSAEYKLAHDKIDSFYDQKEFDIENYLKLKLSVLFRENKFYDSIQLLEKNKNDIKNELYIELKVRTFINFENYSEGLELLDSTNHKNFLPFRVIIHFQMGNYIESEKLSKLCLNNWNESNISLYYQLKSIYYDSCIFNSKSDNDIKLISNSAEITEIIEKTNYGTMEYYALQEQFQLYLIAGIFSKDSVKREKFFEDFIEAAPSVKTFECILKYSNYLSFIPENLLNAFTKNWKLYDKSGYYGQFINNENNVVIKNRFIEIFFWTLIIETQLMIDKTCEVESFNYYTNKDTLLKLIGHDFKMSMLSLSNVNDKVEGEVLFDLLKKNNLSTKITCDISDSKYAAVQTSYTRNKNSLTMFRLYGKENDKEGTGACLSFDKTFFLTNFQYISMKNKEDDNNHPVTKYINPKKPIVWVLYYNKQKNRLFYYPDKDELIPYVVDLNKSKQPWLTKYKGNKQKQIENKLLYSFKNLLQCVTNIPNSTLQQKENAIKLLEKIRYYIKFDDFAEEKECRMLELVLPNDKDVEIIPSNHVLKKDYLLIDEIPGLKEIILGPKMSNYKIVKELIMRDIDSNKANPKLWISDSPLA